MQHACRLILIVFAVTLAGVAEGHVRLLIRNTNWYYTRHHCYIGIPSRGISGGTGMGRGATELRVGGGDVTFAHEDVMGIWPPIAYHCPSRLPGGPEVALDLTFSWIYVADGLCWTHGCQTFAQTFIAEGPELVSVRCFVASPPRSIHVTLHEGGPDGRQIGSRREFSEGTSRWGTVFWRAGEAPTVAGKKYAIVLRSADGTAWNPFVHSLGNCYDEGMAYFDGRPQLDSDLSLLISNPSDGYLRHVPIPNDPRDGKQWSDILHGQRFIARGRNLVFASVEIWGGGEKNSSGVFLAVREGGPQGPPVGQRMRLDHMPGKDRSLKRRGVPFGPDSVRLEPGKTYCATLEFGDGWLPADWKTRMRLYGEEAPGAHPTVASVWTGRIFPDSIEVTWRKGNRSRSVIEYGKPGGIVEGRVEETGEEGWAAIGGLEPDTVYQFRITATSPQAYRHYSPWYLVRTRAKDGTLGVVEPKQHFGIFDPFFLPVADAPLGKPPALPSRSAGKRIVLTNAAFEDGTEGWKVRGELEARTHERARHVRPRQGRRMFGWWSTLEGTPRHDLYRTGRLEQKVAVQSGRWYQLSAWVLTAEPEWTNEELIRATWSFPFMKNRGKIRFALAVDPTGGEAWDGPDVTQWYSTGGAWRLVTKCFQARADEVTIGAVYSQRGERTWDVGMMDDLQLVELDAAPW